MSSEATAIEKFRIDIPQQDLDDLRRTLHNYEGMHSGDWPTPSPVPTGVVVFAEDIAIRRYAEQVNNIVHWSDFDAGGHFAALETPDLLTQDIRASRRRPSVRPLPDK